MRSIVASAVAIVAVVVATVGADARAKPAIVLAHPLPSLARVGDLLTVRGHVDAAPRQTRVDLEIKRTAGGWIALTRASVTRRGAFTLRWRVAQSDVGPVLIRVAATRQAKLLAASAPAQAGIGPAPVYCTPPVPPAVNIPVGDGWIVGGVYLEGGPYPGIDACESQPYTITATTAGGAIAASENVPGGHSYTLVLPAGTYSLKGTPCGLGSATVTAAKQTRASAVCPVP